LRTAGPEEKEKFGFKKCKFGLWFQVMIEEADSNPRVTEMRKMRRYVANSYQEEEGKLSPRPIFSRDKQREA